ncbi:Uncharacterised protein [uncultured archaeon]|nr:Uncharacterised protein [uncultured archaeon]
MNLVTIQEGIYVNDVNGENGRMFKVNHQYCYTDKESVSGGCCGTYIVYTIPVTMEDNITVYTYKIPEKNCVETTVIIQKHYQDFFKVWSRDFLQNMEHHSFKEINNNCQNCNGLIPHGDYSNNVDTGGIKDPEIAPLQDEDGE